MRSRNGNSGNVSSTAIQRASKVTHYQGRHTEWKKVTPWTYDYILHSKYTSGSWPVLRKKIQKARLCKPSGKIKLAAERSIKLSDIRRLDRDLRCTFSSNTQARQQQMKHIQRRGVFCARHVVKLNNSFPQAAVVPENLHCSCNPVRLKKKKQRKHSRLGNSGTKTWLLGSTRRMYHLDAHSLLILPFGHGMRQVSGLTLCSSLA